MKVCNKRLRRSYFFRGVNKNVCLFRASANRPNSIITSAGYKNTRPNRQLLRTYRQQVPEMTKLPNALTARQIRVTLQRRQSPLIRSDQFNDRNSVLTCQFGALASVYQTAMPPSASVFAGLYLIPTLHVCVNCCSPCRNIANRCATSVGS